MRFHSALFARGTQPTESGSADLTNQQLAELATSSGASDRGRGVHQLRTERRGGRSVGDRVDRDAEAATGGQVATPTVVHERSAGEADRRTG